MTCLGSISLFIQHDFQAFFTQVLSDSSILVIKLYFKMLSKLEQKLMVTSYCNNINLNLHCPVCIEFQFDALLDYGNMELKNVLVCEIKI